jgi:hypothetical protein
MSNGLLERMLFLQGFTILQNDFVVYGILPFLLVFVVVFAILQKSRILGEGKKQVDAIVALVIGLIVISFGNAVGIIVGLSTFMAVASVVILVFMILYGMVYKEGEFDLHKNVKLAFGFLIALAVVIAVLIQTGYWGTLYDFFLLGGAGDFGPTIVFIVIIAVAIGSVLWGANGSSSGSSK